MNVPVTEHAGMSWAAPILVAPMAMQKMAHPDGECGTMQAAVANGLGMVRTHFSSPLLLPFNEVEAAVNMLKVV